MDNVINNNINMTGKLVKRRYIYELETIINSFEKNPNINIFDRINNMDCIYDIFKSEIKIEKHNKDNKIMYSVIKIYINCQKQWEFNDLFGHKKHNDKFDEIYNEEDFNIEDLNTDDVGID